MEWWQEIVMVLTFLFVCSIASDTKTGKKLDNIDKALDDIKRSLDDIKYR